MSVGFSRLFRCLFLDSAFLYGTWESTILITKRLTSYLPNDTAQDKSFNRKRLLVSVNFFFHPLCVGTYCSVSE